jgi:ligand-binding sensor domain-containing protein
MPPVREHLRARLIQTICHQMIHAPDRRPVSTLWVGTSAGLLRYRPDVEVWDWAPGALEEAPIQALAVDPRSGYLWVGTPQGLFRLDEHAAHRQCEGNILSLLFSDNPAPVVWVGTSSGLEQWSAPGRGVGLADQPIARFTAVTSGLAADNVTALACRLVDGMPEVWAGSSSGVSCYRY